MLPERRDHHLQPDRVPLLPNQVLAQVDRAQLQLLVRDQIVDVEHALLVAKVRRPDVAGAHVRDLALDAADQDADLVETVSLVLRFEF